MEGRAAAEALGPRLVVASNRLPVTLRPEQDSQDVAQRRVHDAKERVVKQRAAVEKLQHERQAKGLTKSSTAGLVLDQAQAASAPPRSVSSTSAGGSFSVVSEPDKFIERSVTGEVEPEPRKEEEVPTYQDNSLSYWELREALKSLRSTLSESAHAEELVTEPVWKQWVGRAWEEESDNEKKDADSSSRERGNEKGKGALSFEDFQKIAWSGKLQKAMEHYADVTAAWRALCGSLLDKIAASERAVEAAERHLHEAEQALEKERQDPTVPISASSGGLVSAMKIIAGSDKMLWIGWPGSAVGEEKQELYAEVLREKHGYVPVWMTPAEADAFYDGFSNSSLWPLLHWMTPYAHYSDEWSEAYRCINERFADCIIEAIVKDGHRGEYLVWVHDYHLLQVPLMLREKSRLMPYGIKLKIAFFLHTPFPSFEVICCHPNCRELLMGMLGSDLIGFHTYSYLRHFRSSAMRLFGFSTETDHIDHQGHRTKLGVFPIGVNAQGIIKAMDTDGFRSKLQTDYAFKDQFLVLSVERLDYSKGLPQKLAAIRRFLEMAREKELAGTGTLAGAGPAADETGAWRFLPQFFGGRRKTIDQAHLKSVTSRSTRFLFIAVPSRQGVREYKDIEAEVQRTISEINGEFAVGDSQPIIYIHRSIPLEELCALYARADCCLVTPLIDGMNLVAKEFVVAKDPSMKEQGVVPGLVILSEQAGAAQEMFDALVVNPHDIDKVAKSIMIALEIPPDNRWQFITDMRNAVLRNHAGRWANHFLKELMGIHERRISKEKAELLATLLEVHAGCVVARGDWSEVGLKNQVRPQMELVEVAGEPLPAVENVAEVLKLVQEAPHDSVVLGFRRQQAGRFLLPRSASQQVEPLLQVQEQVGEAFARSTPGQKALFLDYDGTLRDFCARPEDAVPDDTLNEVLGLLETREDLEVVLVSGRDASFMKAVFSRFPRFTLVAEHGYLVSEPVPSPDVPRTFRVLNPHTRIDWMDQILPIMESFEENTPGSKVEVKVSACVWHYRNVDPEYGDFKAKELAHTLWQSVPNLPCEVTRGNMIVEVSSLQVKKGLVVRHFVETRRDSALPYRAAICIGDDRTDESMFQYAQECRLFADGFRKGHSSDSKDFDCKLWAVKVGRGDTYADYTLSNPSAVISFLHRLALDQAAAALGLTAEKSEPREDASFEADASMDEDEPTRSRRLSDAEGEDRLPEADRLQPAE